MAARKNANGLTEKQMAFARYYVEVGDARKAYELAGYSQKNSLETQRVNACRLLQETNVALMVEQLQKEHAKRHEITVDTITAMLREDRDLARDIQQPSAAVAAAMGLAKVHGLIIDKSKLSGDPDNPVVTEIRRTIVDSKTTEANGHHQRGSSKGIQAPANTRPI